MKPAGIIVIAAMLVAVAGQALAQSTTRPPAARGIQYPKPEVVVDRDKIRTTLAQLRAASREISTMGRKRPPAGLSRLELKKFRTSTTKLMQVARKLDRFAAKWDSKLSTADDSRQLSNAELQNLLQEMSQKVASISNLMKARRDEAMAVINNIR